MATFLALGVIVALYKVTIPSVIQLNRSFDKVRDASKLRYSKKANVLFITQTQADILIPDADFILGDPFNIESSLFLLSDIKAASTLKRLNSERKGEVQAPPLKYLDVPYEFTTESEAVPLELLLPDD